MRVINFFSLILILASALFTWSTVSAEPMKIHVIENLSAQESKQLFQALTKMGYAPSKKELFSESKNAMLITKAVPTEQEKASLSIELVRLESENELPKTLFQYKLDNNDIQAMAKALPGPEAFHPSEFMPMASESIPQQ